MIRFAEAAGRAGMTAQSLEGRCARRGLRPEYIRGKRYLSERQLELALMDQQRAIYLLHVEPRDRERARQEEEEARLAEEAQLAQAKLEAEPAAIDTSSGSRGIWARISRLIQGAGLKERAS